MLVPINLTGGTYKHKSLPLSAQKTVNFWPQLQSDQGAKSAYILESFPGMTLFSTGGNRERGTFPHQGVLYQVSGTDLVSINSAGVRTVLGVIPGKGRCIFDAMVDSVIIVTGGRVFEWDGSTLAEGDPADFETPQAVTVLNSQAIYDGNESRFCVSDVGEPLTINGLNYGAAEAKADILVRPYAFNEVVRMFGTETTEGWWNSGSGNPPFDRLEGGIVNVGLKALESIGANDRNLYFLGSDSQVYRMSGGDVTPVSPQPITREIDNFTDASDAIGWCMNYQGQEFYILTFPAADRTFIYPENGQWFELSSGVKGGRYIGQGYAYIFGKHLIADKNSHIYELSDDVYSENGEVIQRTRDSAPIHGGLFGVPGKQLEMNSLVLIMETGVGTLANTDPVVMLSFSDDGGKTWSEQMFGDVGAMGQFLYEVRWDCLGAFDSRIIRIQTSDAVYYSIHSASAEIEACI